LWFTDDCTDVECEDGRTCHKGQCRGACFEPLAAESTEPSVPTCAVCERCAGGCEPADAVPCGCGEFCGAGTCVPKRRIVHVAAGSQHTCAALESGDVHCWGTNGFLEGGQGRLGIGSSASDPSPPMTVPEAKGMLGITTGDDHTCSLDANARYCWGSNRVGQLGGSSNPIESSALKIVDPFRLVDLRAGALHTCGLTLDGTVWCWGFNLSGALGVGTTTLRESTPQRVGAGYAAISTGGIHTCALRTDGTLECWGHNNDREVGVAGPDVVPSPVRPGCAPTNTGPNCFSDWDFVGVGASHSCAIRRGGALFCWGSNADGALGIGSDASAAGWAEPQRVGPDVAWASVAGGSAFTCGIDEDRVLRCWGDNRFGQVGSPVAGVVDKPTRVGDPNAQWLALSVGRSHACALRTDHTLWCWGHNDAGQLGSVALGGSVAQPKRICLY
jgi:alpha-tubulin suppressor-like RCC1 family protein